ncbi:MAG: hypothetical protein ACXAEU_15910 [Candidatus Hodarchaeales archaeon]|jgi:hypothetical protein
MSEERIKLICEPCEQCKKVVPISLPKKDFKPSITGVSTVVDIHGLHVEGVKPHVRILYVDERMSVRSFSTVTSIADV